MIAGDGLTNVAADKHFFGCGFAAMVIACLQLNSWR
jgi:membrane associated rhomboid family serine protease